MTTTKHLLGAALLASLLAACGGGNSTPPTPAINTALSSARLVVVASPTPTATPHHQSLYVVDQNPSAPAVAIYQINGGPESQAFLLPTNSQPCSITADWEGRIYVGDQKSGQIFIYDVNGTQIKTLTGFQTPCGLAVKNQTLYVADWQAGNIKRYALPSDTASSTVITDYYPQSIAADSSGNIYVADFNKVSPWGYRITVFSPNGTVLSTIADGFGPYVLALDSSDNVYAAMMRSPLGQNITAINEFSANGTQLALNIKLYNHAPGPWGLAVDATGKIYASEYGNEPHKQRVVEYGVNGFVVNNNIATNLVNPGPIAIL